MNSKQHEKLIKLRDRALKNMRRQKAREEVYGIKHIRVRWTFWEQVVQGYNQEIQKIVAGGKTPWYHELLSLLPEKVVIEGDFLYHSITIDGKKLDIKKSIRVKKYSDRFDWGHGGSGSAQLALALLVKYVDPMIAQMHVHSLKYDLVAKLPKIDFIQTVNLRKIMSDALNIKTNK